MMSKHNELAVVVNKSIDEISDSVDLGLPCKSIGLHKQIVILHIVVNITTLFGKVVAKFCSIVGNESLVVTKVIFLDADLVLESIK